MMYLGLTDVILEVKRVVREFFLYIFKLPVAVFTTSEIIRRKISSATFESSSVKIVCHV